MIDWWLLGLRRRSGPLIYDTFAGNGVDVTAHAIAPINVPGSAWLATLGAFSVQSNVLHSNFGESARVQIGRTDYVAAVTCKTALFGVAVRVLDAGNLFGFYANGTNCNLYEKLLGAYVLRGSVTLSAAINNSVFSIRQSGNDMLCQVHSPTNVLLGAIAYSSATNVSVDYAGVFTSPGYEGDDFIVEAL